MAKKQRDVQKIVKKVLAFILAGLMVFSVAGTLIYYIIASAK